MGIKTGDGLKGEGKENPPSVYAFFMQNVCSIW